MKKILRIVLVLILSFGISGNIFAEDNNIKRVSFYSSNDFSHFLGAQSRLIPLYIEDLNGLPISNYNIEILEGRELLEVIKTDGFRDVLKLKRITDEKIIGHNNISLKIITHSSKDGYIYNKGTIDIIKPILLIGGELGPDGGDLESNWRDIHIKVEKGVLNQVYSINYIGGLSGNGGLILRRDIYPDMSDDLFNELNISMPSTDIIKNNYLYVNGDSNNNKYYIFKNTEEVDFGKVINKQKNIEERNDLIKEQTKQAWKFYKIAYNNAGKNPDFDIININLEKAKKILIEINNEFTEKEKSNDIAKLSKKIIAIERDIEKFKKLHIKKNKSKGYLLKQLIIAKNNLYKTTQGKKYISQLDMVVIKINDGRLEKIAKKLGKMSENLRKNKKYKDILNYLEAKILLRLDYSN